MAVLQPVAEETEGCGCAEAGADSGGNIVVAVGRVGELPDLEEELFIACLETLDEVGGATMPDQTLVEIGTLSDLLEHLDDGWVDHIGLEMVDAC